MPAPGDLAPGGTGQSPGGEGGRTDRLAQGAHMADTVIGSYRITQTLGVGGMGAVYAGEHKELGRKAAIKVLLPELSQNQDVVERFFNEARAAAAIKHPGIVQIYDFDYQADGSAYIAMEFLEGEGLDARLRRLGKLPVQQALRFTGQIASALAMAHGRGIFHRDLKPGNIFIIPDPQVVGGERIKILDFGIAKITRPDDPGAGRTQAGTVMGSPSYMAPEQCRGAGEIDHRADLYSVGCILFEMLCGRPPFLPGEGGYIAIMAAQLNDPPPVPSSLRPELTPEIDHLVLALLAKDPAARPETAAHLAHAISVIAGEQVSFGSLSAVTEVFDAPTGLMPDFGRGPGTAPGSGRLIDQLTSRTGRRSTSGVTGAMSSGVTGRNTDQQMGGIAAAQHTARSRLSQQRLTQAGGARSSRRAIVAGAAILGIVGAVVLVQRGQQTTAPHTAEPAPAEPAVEQPAPQPARKREPRLSFYAIAEQPASGGTAAGAAPVVAAASVAPVVFRLPTFSWTALFSGSFFGGLVSSLTVLTEPAPAMITWKITTSPPGADVLRGDQVVGNTRQPLLIQLEQTPGFTETFTLRLDRHRDQTIELRGDESFDSVIELEPMLFARIDSRPAGAQVLDGQGAVLGTAPMEVPIDSSPGSSPGSAAGNALTLRLDRFEDTPVDFTAELAALEPGKKIEKVVKLVPRIYATVQSKPAGAEVFDAQGASLGVTPVEIPLARGPDGRGGPTPVSLKLDRHEDAAVELVGKKSFRQTVKLVPKIYATVTSRPEGAQVLDAQGQALGVTPLTFELARAAQPARVTLALDGHQDGEATLRGSRSFTKNVKLAPRPRLTIVSEPAGAQVIDAQGQALGATPVDVLLSGKGEPLAFTLKLAGHHDERIEVKTRRDQTVRASLAPEVGPVTVRIESQPAGAEVWKDGKMIGRAPMEDRFEGTGDRLKYTLKLDGYQDRDLRVPGDRDASEVVELRKCAPQRSGQLGIVTVYGGC
jgi:serine/threonine protein kinase